MTYTPVLDDAERMSLDELRALQLRRLQWSVRHAYENVPFYTRSLDAAGVHPDDIRALEDVAALPEIVDSESGMPLPDGTQGELVFTTLTKQAMPVIRYRTHDLSTLLPGTSRPAMRRMAKITGRNDDMIILRGVNLFPTQIEEIALAIPYLSPHFLLELTHEGHLDRLTVRIEPDPAASSSAAADACAVLQREIKARIGSTVTVVAAPVGSLPRSEGKLKRLVDLR
jgi:phenylacetate-CoA ligase